MVLIVKMLVKLVPVLVNEAGLNAPDAPVGKFVTLSDTVQLPELPPKLTVTAKVPEFPTAIGSGFCAPTVTVLGCASVNRVCADKPDASPVAVSSSSAPAQSS